MLLSLRIEAHQVVLNVRSNLEPPVWSPKKGVLGSDYDLNSVQVVAERCFPSP